MQWPDGNYTITVTGKDTGEQTAIPSEIESVVASVDLTKTPPELKVGGQGLHARQDQARGPPAGLICISAIARSPDTTDIRKRRALTRNGRPPHYDLVRSL